MNTHMHTFIHARLYALSVCVIYLCVRVFRSCLVDVCAHECLNNKLGKYFNIHHAIKISRCLAQQTQIQQQQEEEQLLGCLI